MRQSNYKCVYCGTSVQWLPETLNGHRVFIFRTPIETTEACFRCANLAENTRVVMIEKLIEIKERLNSIKNKIF